MEKQFVRKCPQCNKDIFYKHKRYFDKANKNNVVCVSCRKKNENNNLFIKQCPRCNKEMKYKNKTAFNNAVLNNKKCKECIAKEKEIKEHKMYERMCPVCGKTIVYKSKGGFIGATKANNPCKSCSNTEEVKLKKSIASSGKNNPMYGKSMYDIWIEKYGKEEADIKYKLWHDKILQRNFNGKNNPMYGKPAPQGSGNGWSGHYKGVQFRSLLELYYLIYLIDNNIKFENGELKKYAIQYVMDGLERNYFPDFYLIDTQEIIEIKPKNLVGTYQNKLKFEAAKNKLGNKYVILTENEIEKIDVERLYNVYINKELEFDERYEIKFKQYIENLKNE